MNTEQTSKNIFMCNFYFSFFPGLKQGRVETVNFKLQGEVIKL